MEHAFTIRAHKRLYSTAVQRGTASYCTALYLLDLDLVRGLRVLVQPARLVAGAHVKAAAARDEGHQVGQAVKVVERALLTQPLHGWGGGGFLTEGLHVTQCKKRSAIDGVGVAVAVSVVNG